LSNEIKVTAALECSNGNFNLPKQGSSQLLITQTTRGGGVPGMISAATGGTDVSTTGVTTLGWCRIVNTDPTNYVTYGPKSGGAMIPFGRLKPGEAAVFRLEPGITLTVTANTAACKVQITILED
jgi:hypothetical protein